MSAVGAHCPDHNRSGWGVQVMIGGDQKPSPAAMDALVDLYDWLSSQAGRSLAKKRHRDGFATACCGIPLGDWVVAGMPRPGGVPRPTLTPSTAPVLTPAKTPAKVPAKTPAKAAVLTVNGAMGPATVKRWQQVLGVSADGVLGPQTVRAIQRRVGLKGAAVDGVMGPTTIKAIQRHLGTPADGVISKPSSSMVTALQRRLNAGKF